MKLTNIKFLIQRRDRTTRNDSEEQSLHERTIIEQFIPTLNFTTLNIKTENVKKKNTNSDKDKLVNSLKSYKKNIEMDEIKASSSSNKSDDNSIEEEIEEAITAGSVEEDNDDNSSLNENNTKDNNVLNLNKRKLFDIDDQLFNIDDEELSGVNLAAHFQPLSDEADIPKSQSDKDVETPSLTNQSTTNDVSDLFDESNLPISSLEKNVQSPQSLPASKSLTLQENATDDKSNLSLSSHHSDKDHSMEEIIESNHSIEMTFDDHDLREANSSIIADDKSDSIKLDHNIKSHEAIENVSLDQQTSSSGSGTFDDMNDLKQRILSIKENPKTTGPHMSREISFEQNEEQAITVKQMEKVHIEFTKEILEDITEESERTSTNIDNRNNTLSDPDSIVSLNMIEMFKRKLDEEMIANKSTGFTSLNMTLDSGQRRESAPTLESLKEQPPSGRDSCSLQTTSTEYRTLQEDFAYRNFDFHTELTQRDSLIEKLTDSLQQSLQIRENLEQQSEKLTVEVQQLRKQLTDALETMKKSYWPRDQESSGQRISEISIDLVSESDEDYDRNFLTDNEDKFSLNSRERQLSVPRGDFMDVREMDLMPVSKQIEQFQKYLAPDEVRIFFMVQKKFDDFLSQEVEKVKMKCEGENKIMLDQMESEKHELDVEVNRLRQLLTNIKSGTPDIIQLRQELEAIHSKEMEDLRQYFEKKCADLEKQYSDEIFSHKSQFNGNDTSSEISDQENLPEEKFCSPRKRTREELYASPSHRQLTPHQNIDDDQQQSNNNYKEPKNDIEELKVFYENKIATITKNNDDVVRKLHEKLKRFESKYADDEFMPETRSELNETNENAAADGPISLIIIDEDEIKNENQIIHKIVEEYEKRLQEQVALAKSDIFNELEIQIQALLSETTTDDQHWPPELILLREKFTAKSQLEIAQIQIKHEEEMSRLKADFDKQLTRKLKRNSTFDLSRDLDQIISERDELRELSTSFRYVLSELAKCVTICEEDLNATFVEELQKIENYHQRNLTLETCDDTDNNNANSTDWNLNDSNRTIGEVPLSKRFRIVPDVSSLLSIVNDPILVGFMTDKNDNRSHFDLKECLDRLRNEAQYLLKLSEDLNKKQQNKLNTSNTIGAEKNDSCEEEDGLKSRKDRTPQKYNRANSLNENTLRENLTTLISLHNSLPPDFNRTQLNESILEDFSSVPMSELNFQVNELKNRLVKSEADRLQLQSELELTINQNSELGHELNALKQQLDAIDSNREEYNEGYGLGMIRSPQLNRASNQITSFCQLQEKARNLLSTPTNKSIEDTTHLLQMIEDFCREGEKVVENGKKDREDLQSQIIAADKQLKATRQFLEDQAAERELERDEFLKDIEKLKHIIREKEKERNLYANASNENIDTQSTVRESADQLEQQIKELTNQIQEEQGKREKFEIELKASIDKIFVLREIISELETQIETKALNEHVLNEKVKHLETFINSQSRSNVTLQQEIESLKMEIGQDYQTKISQLEEQLQNARPSAEQSVILEQLIEQLCDIETTLDNKIKTLESLHHNVSSLSCSTSPIEDVSVQQKPLSAIVSPSQGSPVHPSPRQHSSLPIQEVQRVLDKLSKHTRVEEAAIKRIRDLEMQVGNIRASYAELQNERDTLQERMSEQMGRISSLQSKLEEQRHRAEELQRSGSSNLNIRIHDLQNNIQDLKETLSVRDKQIANMKNQLEQSKMIIERLEAELAMSFHNDRSAVEKLEIELQAKTEENQRFREKIKNEMINKIALPDLMETMLADKNEEIDHLKEQLDLKDKELKELMEINLSGNGNGHGKQRTTKDGAEVEGKLSARTLSDIVSISEFDEPDVIRRDQVEVETPLALPDSQRFIVERTIDTSKEAIANLTEHRTEELKIFEKPHPMPTFDHPHYFQNPSIPMQFKSGSSITPEIVPRQINFSEFKDDSQVKGSTPNPQISISNENVNILKNKLKMAESEIESLKLKLETVDNEKNDAIQRLTGDLNEKSRKLNELTSEKDNLNKQISEMAKQLVKLKKYEEILDNRDKEFTKLEDRFMENELKLAELHDGIQSKIDEIQNLKDNITALNEKISSLKKSNEETEQERKQLNELNLKQADDLKQINQIYSDSTKEMEILQSQLIKERSEFADKELNWEKLQKDYQLRKNDIEKLKNILKDKDIIISTLNTDTKKLQDFITSLQETKPTDVDNLAELKNKLKVQGEQLEYLKNQNMILEKEFERLKSQSSESSKPFSLDEIAKQVEKELNYSAQLDSNILKAIESEEENNLDADNINKTTSNNETDLLNQIEILRAQLELEKDINSKLQGELCAEKQHSQAIQEQDVNIIEAMRIRLEEALSQEHELHQILDSEREKCERLATQISVLQRNEARKSSLLIKSPPDSPRKSLRSSDSETELSERLKSEIKLLTAQNERERERIVDLQRNLEREKVRFTTELKDRIEYGDKLKREMDKILKDKEIAEQEVDHLQERLSLQSQEIESLEIRIATLQQAETRRVARRGREREETTQNAIELQELKTKIVTIEKERDHLTETISILRSDIERGSKREAKLAEALASNSGSESSIPQQFLQKIKEMNNLLVENTKENRQMAETVQCLFEERRMLQKRCEDLESQGGGVTPNINELQDRANYLLERYLRVESHRKALVFQKRYLLVSLQSYQDSEARVINLMGAGRNLRTPSKLTFKTAVLAVIAIHRMKFIVKRWLTGKRIVSKSVFTITKQRRPSSSSSNLLLAPISTSPPCRDTTPQHSPFTLIDNLTSPITGTTRPLQAPRLINDCVQKFDWSKLKKN